MAISAKKWREHYFTTIIYLKTIGMKDGHHQSYIVVLKQYRYVKYLL